VELYKSTQINVVRHILIIHNFYHSKSNRKITKICREKARTASYQRRRQKQQAAASSSISAAAAVAAAAAWQQQQQLLLLLLACCCSGVGSRWG
jgi:hypothetical protein